MFWAYLLVVGGWSLSCTVSLMRVDPDLVAERMRPGPGAAENIRLLQAGAAVIWVCHYTVAGLDVGRFGWSGSISPVVKLPALVVVVICLAVIQAVMLTNRFASSALRLQHERGQYVVTDGPYRFVRHPMYTALIVMGPATAIALGSWWAILPIVPGIFWTLRRTIMEDRMLMEGLPGYRDYAARVRFRLVPGLW